MENKEKNFISAIVYIHNVENTIESFLQGLMKVLHNNFEKYEVICVNDGSDDKSVEVIKKVIKNRFDGVVTVINMSYYQGIELSMNAGTDLAIGDFVFEFDTVNVDYNFDLLMDVYRKCLEGYDIVSASPMASSRFMSKMFYAIFNKSSKLMYKLQTESFRILSRRAINRVHAMNKSIPYRKAVYANCGLNLTSIKYACNSISKVNRKQLDSNKNTAINSIILFTNLAYKMSLFLATLMILFTVGIAVYTLLFYLKDNPVEGWTTTMLFLSMAFFGVFSIFAIIIKYLSLILEMIFKRQKYLVESIEKITK